MYKLKKEKKKYSQEIKQQKQHTFLPLRIDHNVRVPRERHSGRLLTVPTGKAMFTVALEVMDGLIKEQSLTSASIETLYSKTACQWD